MSAQAPEIVAALRADGATEPEILAAVQQAFGMKRGDAQFYIDFVDGKTQGDVVAADKGAGQKDAEFERLHPRYPPGHPDAGKFMDKADVAKLAKMRPFRYALGALPSRSPRYAPIGHGVEAMEKVLLSPPLSEQDRLRSTQFGGIRKDLQGRYDSLDNDVQLFDLRLDYETILKFHEHPGSANTYVHEIGHFTDSRVLPEPLGVQDTARAMTAHNALQVEQGHEENFAYPSAIALTLDAVVEKQKTNEPLTHGEEAVFRFVHAAYTSPTITHLRDLAARPDGEPMMVHSPAFGTDIPVLPDVEYAKYLTSLAEVWARAFEQYIGEKAESQPMMDYVRWHRGQTEGSAMKYHHYWGQAEFAAISDTIDKIFAAVGMLHPAF